MPEDVEPLTSDLWFERIEMIANGELKSTEHALRHALHLLQLTPRQFRHREPGTIDEASYEALLEAGNFEAAARRLVAAPTLSVTAASIAGDAEAAIRCNMLNRTIFGKGDSVAAAILQAWAECLLALRSEFDANRLNEVNGR